MAPQAVTSVTPSDRNAKPPKKAKTGLGKGGSLEKQQPQQRRAVVSKQQTTTIT
jgi:hypothetical protein